jgi:hypothetical protein
MDMPQLQEASTSNLFAESANFMDLLLTPSQLSSPGPTLDWANPARDMQELLQLPD